MPYVIDSLVLKKNVDSFVFLLKPSIASICLLNITAAFHRECIFYIQFLINQHTSSSLCIFHIFFVIMLLKSAKFNKYNYFINIVVLRNENPLCVLTGDASFWITIKVKLDSLCLLSVKRMFSYVPSKNHTLLYLHGWLRLILHSGVAQADFGK